MNNTLSKEASRQGLTLVAIKTLHTAIWGLLAGCIVALPFVGVDAPFRLGTGADRSCSGRMRRAGSQPGGCPLTDMAARWTTERTPSFDELIVWWEWLKPEARIRAASTMHKQFL